MIADAGQNFINFRKATVKASSVFTVVFSRLDNQLYAITSFSEWLSSGFEAKCSFFSNFLLSLILAIRKPIQCLHALPLVFSSDKNINKMPDPILMWYNKDFESQLIDFLYDPVSHISIKTAIN